MLQRDSSCKGYEVLWKWCARLFDVASWWECGWFFFLSYYLNSTAALYQIAFFELIQSGREEQLCIKPDGFIIIIGILLPVVSWFTIFLNVQVKTICSQANTTTKYLGSSIEYWIIIVIHVHLYRLYTSRKSSAIQGVIHPTKTRKKSNHNEIHHSIMPGLFVTCRYGIVPWAFQNHALHLRS